MKPCGAGVLIEPHELEAAAAIEAGQWVALLNGRPAQVLAKLGPYSARVDQAGNITSISLCGLPVIDAPDAPAPAASPPPAPSPQLSLF